MNIIVHTDNWNCTVNFFMMYVMYPLYEEERGERRGEIVDNYI